MARPTQQPKLKEPFPLERETWTCPKTGLIVPKQKENNVIWRMELLKRAESDEGMQKDLLAACAESLLVWINAFGMTYHQFDVDPDGKRIESDHPNQPMITWPIQDELFDTFEECLATGQDILLDKSRDMGASWCCIFFLHWLILFRKEPCELLEMSRNESYVDAPGNMKALMQKHDKINEFLPDWMRPPDCFRGQANRRHLHWHNPITGSNLDGESTTRHASRGDRRLIGLLDEFGAVMHGSEMRAASRDACLMRIINSTSVPGSEYNKWRSDPTANIKKFVMPFYEHPEKGKGRYVKKAKSGKWEIRSPWLDHEEATRGHKFLATEVLREDTEPGLSFFQEQVVDTHITLNVRPPNASYHIKWHKAMSDQNLIQAISNLDRTNILIKQQMDGSLKLWCPLIEGRPSQKDSYIFGIDVSKGQEASNSVISIKCRETGEKIGEFASAEYPPYEFAPLVVAIALWFGGAKPMKLPFLKWENNGPGWDFGRLMVKKFLYPYYYMSKATGQVNDPKQRTYGFHMGRDSKYVLLSAYDKALANGSFINHSLDALEEARLYIHYENGGIGPATMTHESSSAKQTHGDRVIADALANDDTDFIKRKRDKEPKYPTNSAGARFISHIKNRARRRQQKNRGFDFSIGN
jgi:hypothetical protein